MVEIEYRSIYHWPNLEGIDGFVHSLELGFATNSSALEVAESLPKFPETRGRLLGILVFGASSKKANQMDITSCPCCLQALDPIARASNVEDDITTCLVGSELAHFLSPIWFISVVDDMLCAQRFQKLDFVSRRGGGDDVGSSSNSELLNRRTESDQFS